MWIGERYLKKRIVLGAAALATALALLVLIMGLLRGTRVITLEPVALPGEGRDMMRVTASVGEDLRRVTGTQTFTATNRTGQALDGLVLRLYPNGENEGSLVLSGVTVSGQAADYEWDADDRTVARIRADWQPGQTLEFAWRFTLSVPRGDGYVARTDASALCIGALAVPALWQDGAWRTDEWDALAGPLAASGFDYELTLTAPKSIRAAFGGALTSRSEADGEIAWTAQGSGALDMPFALRTGGAMRRQEACGVLVTALADSDAQARALLSQTEKALKALDGLGLPYAGRALSVAQASTGFEDGLIGSGLIAVGEERDAEALLRRLTRLIARQTFGIAAQNDPWNEPWLSVSLASVAELLAYRHRAGERAYEERFFEEIEIATRLTRPQGVTVGAAVDRFGGDAEMTQVLRDQGAAMLLGIEQAVGEDAFLRALTLYVQKAQDVPASRALLEEALFAATGSRWDGYLEDELSW